MTIKIIEGDITELDVDAIVNSANRSILGGGGVDGAIHKAAGHKLLDECLAIRKTTHIKGLAVGEAVITKGYNLPAKHVIHTLGPVLGKDDMKLLLQCYINCLRIADENKLESIAFPSISTGAHGIPITQAAKIVHEVINEYDPKSVKEIIFVLHNEDDYRIYLKEFKE
jgi:O-acetyl-ADP-ribose deacetylase